MEGHGNVNLDAPRNGQKSFSPHELANLFQCGSFDVTALGVARHRMRLRDRALPCEKLHRVKSSQF